MAIPTPASDRHAFDTADRAADNSFPVQRQEPGEAYTATVPSYLVEHPEATVVDTGVSPDLHSDHAGNVDLFPGAESVVQGDELRYAWWPDTSWGRSISRATFRPSGRTRSTSGSSRAATTVLGDGSVVTIPTPGHTPGHQSVVVDLGGEAVVLGADVARRKPGYDDQPTASFNWRLEESLASVRHSESLAREEDASVRLVHDRDALAD